MLILDHLKRSNDFSIIIPPFHTGHLGFIPGTEVNVTLLAPYKTAPTHCEVIMSPFHQDMQNMVYLSCTMRDEIGVVGHLIEAVSALGINIEAEESSGINYLNHHSVNLTIDLSTSKLRQSPTKASAARLYRDYGTLFPIHDSRYIKVFESIVAHCAEFLMWKEIAGKSLPDIRMRPLSSNMPHRFHPTSVKTVPNKPYHVSVRLPENIGSSILNRLKHPSDKPLPCILLSDTDEKTVRVFFPTTDLTDRLVHIGFYHDDAPGVLYEIINAVARSRFNVLTSLLRKQTASRNVWEAILHYKGSDDFPTSADGEEVCGRIAMLLRQNSDNVNGLIASNIEIGLPLYPKVKGAWSGKIPLTQRGGELVHNPRTSKDIMVLLQERQKAVQDGALDAVDARSLSDLIGMVVRVNQQNVLPKIFLSYPMSATRHAGVLKNELNEAYRLDEYQLPDGEVILDQVLQKILDSDFFIGIWHHDESLPTSNGKYNISPWMPFEYGIALAVGKPTIVIHSEKLDEKIWKRINPGVAQPEYSDVFFTSKTLPMIAAFCRKHFQADARHD